MKVVLLRVHKLRVEVVVGVECASAYDAAEPVPLADLARDIIRDIPSQAIFIFIAPLDGGGFRFIHKMELHFGQSVSMTPFHIL